MTDLQYTKDGMFTRFIPNTPEGESAWRVMAQADGVAAVLNMHAQGVIRQLRKAGYTVSKAKPCAMSIDEILADLEA